jgi:hypothetical protein
MPTTPIDALYLHAAARPDDTAFIYESAACTYCELASEHLARALLFRGVGHPYVACPMRTRRNVEPTLNGTRFLYVLGAFVEPQRRHLCGAERDSKEERCHENAVYPRCHCNARRCPPRRGNG